MTRRQQLFVFGFLALLILQQIFAASPETGSTFATTPRGTKAIYLLLERLDESDLERFIHPFSALPKEAENTVLIINSPETMGGEEELVKWIGKGGRVILLSSDEPYIKQILKVLGQDTEKGKSRRFLDEEGTITVEYKKDDSKSSFTISDFRPMEIKLPKGAELISGSTVEPKIFRYAFELGELVFVADSKIIQNQYIDREDNLDFLLKLFSGRDKILFDEFHHGFVAPVPSERESQMEALIWLVATLAVILLLFIVSRSVRFGPPGQLEILHNPTSSPFVIAIGNLFFLEKASSILATYVRAFRLRIERQSGISHLSPSDRFIREITEKQNLTLDDAADLERAITELNALADGKLPSWERHILPLEKISNRQYNSHTG